MYKKIMKVLLLQYLFVLSAALVLVGQAFLYGLLARDANGWGSGADETECVTEALMTKGEKEPKTWHAYLKELRDGLEKEVQRGFQKELRETANADQQHLREGTEMLYGDNAMEAQEFSSEEISVLERIVEAEAGGEDADGKLLVANVVLNRVRDEQFPNTIKEVVFQQSGGVTQFSPVKNGRYDSVTVSEESKEAVERALAGEDISEGALYFAARKYANPKSMTWFDENLTLLFQHGGHEFFK